MLFVTHSKIVTDLMDHDEQNINLKVISGILGTGKTSILRHLESNSTDDIERRIRLTIDEFNPGHPGDRGETASVGAVQGSYKYYVALLSKILEKANHVDSLNSFKNQKHAILHAEIYRLRVPESEWTNPRALEPLSPQQLAQAWKKAAQAISASFEKLWNQTIAQETTLLLLDNFDLIEDQEMGVWLSGLLPKLKNTWAILTVDPERSDPNFFGTHTSYVTIPQLSRQAVEQWITELDEHKIPASQQLLDQIFEASQGHPATLALVHELVWATGVPAGHSQHKLLKSLPEDPTMRRQILAQRFVNYIDDPLLRKALQVISVPRHFNKDILDYLLQDENIDKHKTTILYDEIINYSFVEDISDIPDVEKFRIHTAVRKGVVGQLIKNDYQLYETMNERMVNYYGQLLVKEDDPGTPYGAFFLYEDQNWQERKRGLLYHSGLLTNENGRRKAILRICKVFLDAMYWWGWYVHFDFSDQLVSDLRSLVEQRKDDKYRMKSWPELAHVQSAFQSIVDKYPMKNLVARKEQWDTVQSAFHDLLHYCHLQEMSTITVRQDLERLDPLERDICAMINVFLAMTYRPDHIDKIPADEATKLASRAEEYYDRAEIQFVDDWTKAWVAYHKADLAFSQQDFGCARAHWIRSVGLRNRDDHELTSNLHRLHGNLEYVDKRYQEACAAYGRAVLHAYLFHFAEEKGPDEYTLQFHIDIVSHALEHLRMLWIQGAIQTSPEKNQRAKESALQCAYRMSAQLGPGQVATDRNTIQTLLTEGRPVALAQALFPRAPEVHELEDSGSDFGKAHRKLVAHLHMARVKNDLRP